MYHRAPERGKLKEDTELNGFDKGDTPHHQNSVVEPNGVSQEVGLYSLAADVDESKVARIDPYSEVIIKNRTEPSSEVTARDNIEPYSEVTIRDRTQTQHPPMGTGAERDTQSGEGGSQTRRSSLQEVTLMENNVYDP